MGSTEGGRLDIGARITLLEKDTLFVFVFMGLEDRIKERRKVQYMIEIRLKCKAKFFPFTRESVPYRLLFSTDEIAKQSTNK
jgi:hypothetical protein